MNIQVTSRKFRAKDTLKDFITTELKSLERFSDEIMEANVILSFIHANNSIKNVEIALKVPGNTLRISETGEDFHKSVSLGVDKLSRQLRKLKTKRLAKKR
ncbi:MAG: ribosome-associated translation inhibitor RaiA [bacterium]